MIISGIKYSNNTFHSLKFSEHDLIHIDRGHVDPNEINNEDPDAQDTTFTLTNVAPQASIFNGTVLNLLNNFSTRSIL
jgi:DNA/RNA endonuclease G (NUC1)